MPWKQDLIDKMADILRFTLKLCVFIDLLMFSVFGVYFSAKFTWYLAKWLDRVLFSSPW